MIQLNTLYFLPLLQAPLCSERRMGGHDVADVTVL